MWRHCEALKKPKQSIKNTIDDYFALLVNLADCHESALFYKSADFRNDGIECDLCQIFAMTKIVKICANIDLSTNQTQISQHTK